VSASADLIEWSPPQLLYDPFTSGLPHLQNAFYPTLIDPSAPDAGDDNYETVGRNVTLLYVQNTPNFFNDGRYVVGVNFTIDS